MLRLTVRSKETTLAVVLMTTDAQLGKRNMRGSHDNPQLHPPKQQPEQETSEENSSTVIKMFKCDSPRLLASGRGMGGKDPVLVRDRALRI